MINKQRKGREAELRFTGISSAAALRVVRYLKGTINLCLRFDGNVSRLLDLVAYSDADYAANVDDRKSVTGYALFLAGGAICWGAKKQSTVSTSTAESELQAINTAARQIIYTCNLLAELGFPQHDPTTLHCNNTAVNSIARNTASSTHTCHLPIKIFYIREQVQQGTINTIHCPTAKMTADIFTKPLPHVTHAVHRASLGLVPLDDEARAQLHSA